MLNSVFRCVGHYPLSEILGINRVSVIVSILQRILGIGLGDNSVYVRHWLVYCTSLTVDSVPAVQYGAYSTQTVLATVLTNVPVKTIQICLYNDNQSPKSLNIVYIKSISDNTVKYSI
jgi:hypothetical protein